MWVGGRSKGPPKKTNRLKGVMNPCQSQFSHDVVICVKIRSAWLIIHFQRFFVGKTGNIRNLSWELLAANFEGFFIRKK